MKTAEFVLTLCLTVLWAGCGILILLSPEFGSRELRIAMSVILMNIGRMESSIYLLKNRRR